MTTKKVQQAYDSLASDYEHNVDKQNIYNIYYERPAMMNLFKQDLTAVKILDAGCAAGWYTEQLLMRGAEVTAMDLSAAMVEATKRRVGDRANVRQVDLAKKLPFQEEAFDTIVSSLVLHYIEDWQLTFAEFSRVLKPGGRLQFSIHHPMMDICFSDEQQYFSKELIVDQWERQGRLIDVPFYRRSFSEIFASILQHFSIERVVEPTPTQQCKAVAPETYAKLMKQPHFLIFQVRKI